MTDGGCIKYSYFVNNNIYFTLYHNLNISMLLPGMLIIPILT